MPISLRQLVAEPALGLRLINDGTTALREATEPAKDDAPIDRPVLWAHSSDLLDPTPWLGPGQVLLTNGAQFQQGVDTDRDVAAYVRRLVQSGVLALGFAIDVVHDEIPYKLAIECAKAGMPLIEVDGRTPFIAVVRHIADVQAAESRERLEWSITAQRSLARAALRPNGLTAVLLELETQLGGWVAMFDASGHRVPVRTRRQVPPPMARRLEAQAREILNRGLRSAARLEGAGPQTEVTMQTLGVRGRLRGVLAVESATPLDPAGRDLLTSVIALASIALDQSHALDAARRELRSGLLELLTSGNYEVVQSTARRVWGGLTIAPLRACMCFLPERPESLVADLELSATESHGQVFYGEVLDRLVAITPAGLTGELTDVLIHEHGRQVGTSGVGSWQDLTRLLREARQALQHSTPTNPNVNFEQIVETGLLGVLQAQGGKEIAERQLHPLLSADNAQELHEALSTWMAHNCAWDPAARSLGIHRHTLRHRVETAGRLLARNLDSFSDRTEVWSALRLLD